MNVSGGLVLVEESVFRGTVVADGTGVARAIHLQPECNLEGCFTEVPAEMVLRDSALLSNVGKAISVAGSVLTMDRTTVRDTRNQTDELVESGLLLRPPNDHFDVRSRAHVVQSSIARNVAIGAFASGSDLTVERTIIAENRGEPLLGGGSGIDARTGCVAGCAGSLVQVRDSVVQDSESAGINVVGSSLTMVGSVVRGTEPTDSGYDGVGVWIRMNCEAGGCDPSLRGSATITNSIIADNHEAGVFVDGADARIETSVIEGTQRSYVGGYGIAVAPPCVTPEVCLVDYPGVAEVYGTLVERNHGGGVVVAGSILRLHGSRIFDTLPSDQGRFGDAVALRYLGVPAHATLVDNLVARAARGAIANFGSQAVIANNILLCADPTFIRDPFAGIDPITSDEGGNICGCGVPSAPCSSADYTVEPPLVLR